VYGDQPAVNQTRKRKRKAKTKKLKKAKKKKTEVVPFLLSSLSLLYSVDIYMELVWVALVYTFSFVKCAAKVFLDVLPRTLNLIFASFFPFFSNIHCFFCFFRR